MILTGLCIAFFGINAAAFVGAGVIFGSPIGALALPNLVLMVAAIISLDN